MSPDQFGRVLAWAFVGGFCAAAAGVWWGRASYHFLFLFVRRRPSWRRFDRAMARMFSRLNGE